MLQVLKFWPSSCFFVFFCIFLKIWVYFTFSSSRSKCTWFMPACPANKWRRYVPNPVDGVSMSWYFSSHSRRQLAILTHWHATWWQPERLVQNNAVIWGWCRLSRQKSMHIWHHCGLRHRLPKVGSWGYDIRVVIGKVGSWISTSVSKSNH